MRQFFIYISAILTLNLSLLAFTYAEDSKQVEQLPNLAFLALNLKYKVLSPMNIKDRKNMMMQLNAMKKWYMN